MYILFQIVSSHEKREHLFDEIKLFKRLDSLKAGAIKILRRTEHEIETHKKNVAYNKNFWTIEIDKKNINDVGI